MNIREEFQKVRDIPYRIPLSIQEVDNSCSGKAERLFHILKDAGYEVHYRMCTFRWSDLNIPPNVSSIPHENESTHTYLEVKTGNGWGHSSSGVAGLPHLCGKYSACDDDSVVGLRQLSETSGRALRDSLFDETGALDWSAGILPA